MAYLLQLQHPWMIDLIRSLVLLLLLLLVRYSAGLWLARKLHMSVEERRRWLVTIRNALLVVFMGGLLVIWAHELRTFAVSVVAFAAALVLATKELILCFSGGVLRASNGIFDVGDRVEIGTVRGEVIDIRMLGITLREVGKGMQLQTGRTVSLPNSLLLTTPVINESFAEQYMVHMLTVTLAPTDDWQRAEAILLEAAHTECAAFADAASQWLQLQESRLSVDAPSVAPRVWYQIPKPDTLQLSLRFAVPTAHKGRIEQAILRHFLVAFYPKHPIATAPPPPDDDNGTH
jgi:hypothetical protein